MSNLTAEQAAKLWNAFWHEDVICGDTEGNTTSNPTTATTLLSFESAPGYIPLGTDAGSTHHRKDRTPKVAAFLRGMADALEKETV